MWGVTRGPNSILKSIIKIEGFQLTDKRAIKCTFTNVCQSEFHIVGAATRKLHVPKLSLYDSTQNKLDWLERDLMSCCLYVTVSSSKSSAESFALCFVQCRSLPEIIIVSGCIAFSIMYSIPMSAAGCRLCCRLLVCLSTMVCCT